MHRSVPSRSPRERVGTLYDVQWVNTGLFRETLIVQFTPQLTYRDLNMGSPFSLDYFKQS